LPVKPPSVAAVAADCGGGLRAAQCLPQVPGLAGALRFRNHAAGRDAVHGEMRRGSSRSRSTDAGIRRIECVAPDQ
jgi:hypothetical protein